MRLEAQLVAETYHLLREEGYNEKSFFMEYYYVKKIGNENRKLKADLIYGDDESTHVVEFKAIKNRNLKEGGDFRSSTKKIIKDTYDKLIDYSAFKEVGYLAMVIAFLGPNDFYHPKSFAESVIEALHGNTKFKGRRGQEIEILPC